MSFGTENLEYEPEPEDSAPAKFVQIVVWDRTLCALDEVGVVWRYRPFGAPQPNDVDKPEPVWLPLTKRREQTP